MDGKNIVENSIPSNYTREWDKDWYRDLSMPVKRSVLEEAIRKYPPLASHMKLHGVKASNKDFVEHYCFKMMVDVLRGN